MQLTFNKTPYFFFFSNPTCIATVDDGDFQRFLYKNGSNTNPLNKELVSSWVSYLSNTGFSMSTINPLILNLLDPTLALENIIITTPQGLIQLKFIPQIVDQIKSKQLPGTAVCSVDLSSLNSVPKEFIITNTNSKFVSYLSKVNLSTIF